MGSRYDDAELKRGDRNRSIRPTRITTTDPTVNGVGRAAASAPPTRRPPWPWSPPQWLSVGARRAETLHGRAYPREHARALRFFSSGDAGGRTRGAEVVVGGPRRVLVLLRFGVLVLVLVVLVVFGGSSQYRTETRLGRRQINISRASRSFLRSEKARRAPRRCAAAPGGASSGAPLRGPRGRPPGARSRRGYRTNRGSRDGVLAAAARGTAALPGTGKKAGTGSSQSPSSSSSFSRSPSPRRTRFFPLGRSLLAKASRPLKDAEGHDPRRWGASSRGAAGRARLSADAVMGANARRPRRVSASLPASGGLSAGKRGRLGRRGSGEARVSAIGPPRAAPGPSPPAGAPPGPPRLVSSIAVLAVCPCSTPSRADGDHAPRQGGRYFFRTWEHRENSRLQAG